MSEKLTLAPGDYIVKAGGLKIENTSNNMVIEVELPESYTIRPQIIKTFPTKDTDHE